MLFECRCAEPRRWVVGVSHGAHLPNVKFSSQRGLHSPSTIAHYTRTAVGRKQACSAHRSASGGRLGEVAHVWPQALLSHFKNEFNTTQNTAPALLDKTPLNRVRTAHRDRCSPPCRVLQGSRFRGTPRWRWVSVAPPHKHNTWSHRLAHFHHAPCSVKPLLPPPLASQPATSPPRAPTTGH